MTLSALWILTASLVSFGSPESKQLFFPFEKNSIKILPQRFEYELMNEKEMRIGDEIFRSQDLSFSFAQPKPGASTTLARFQWSGSMFLEGKFVLMDSTGKAIWSKEVPSKGFKVEKRSQGDVRSESYKYDDRSFPAATLTRLRLYPFFRFCMAREGDRTHVLFCSRDLYVKSEPKQKKLSLKARTTAPEAQLEINGQEVSEKGIIFLETVNDPLILRAHFKNGALMDLETRLQSVEFRDITLNEKNKIIVKAAGAEPADPKMAKKLGANTWLAELDPERPEIYLKGSAGIPMKQEFLVKGKLRPQDLNIEAADELKTQTYSSSYAISLRKPKDWKAQAEEDSHIESEEDTSLTWVMEDLGYDEPNRRHLKLTKGDQVFYAAHELTRFRSWQYLAVAGAPLDAQISATKWLEGFRFGTRFEADRQFMTFQSDDPALGWFGLSALMNFTPTILGQGPQTGALLGVRNWTADSASNLGLAAGVYTQGPAPSWFKGWGEQWLADFQFHSGMGGDTTKVKTALETNLLLTREWQEGRNWIYGLQIMSTQAEKDEVSKNLIWFSIRGGISGIF